MCECLSVWFLDIFGTDKIIFAIYTNCYIVKSFIINFFQVFSVNDYFVNLLDPPATITFDFMVSLFVYFRVCDSMVASPCLAFYV